MTYPRGIILRKEKYFGEYFHMKFSEDDKYVACFSGEQRTFHSPLTISIL